MMYLGAQEMAKGKDVISLGVGTPYYPASTHAHDHIRYVMAHKEDIDKYTFFTGIPKLREIIAEQSAKKLGLPVSSDEILVTPGSMAALFYTMMTLLDPGSEVIIPSPYFPSYTEQIGMMQGRVVAVPLAEKHNELHLDMEGIEQAVTRHTKMILLNSPQNPTGAVYAKEDLVEVARIAQKHDLYIVTDEVYDYLLYENTECFNIASIKDLWPKVVRCCSFSKKYALMGWRIGYIHTNKPLLMTMMKVHDAIIVCAPHASQEAAIAALIGPQSIVDEYRKLMIDNRSLILSRYKRLPDLFTCIPPKGAYYSFPSFSLKQPSIDVAKTLLYETGVITVPGIGFGQGGENHLRISFGAKPEDINRAFDRIEKWWENKKK